MTDISDWAATVHIMEIPAKNVWNGQEENWNHSRIMVPLNDYQMGNLIDAISQVPETGDWYQEFIAIVARAMKVGNIKQLTSNNGKTWTYEEIWNGKIRKE